jgi:general secretion pathway protein K
MNYSVSVGARNRGFALAAVLWLLAGLTILAAMISQSNQILAQRQAQLKLRADAEQEFLSSRSEALYWLSSSQATQDGFGWSGQLLRVDGRAYAGSGKSSISIQDVRGLLSLNRPKRDMLARFLVYCGAAPSQTDALLDALEDYAEKGELKRLNGAKSLEYSTAGLKPPRFAPLLAEPELWRVYGWKQIELSWNEKQCSESVTVAGDNRFNPGTATRAALFAYGMNAEQLELIAKERQTGDTVLIDSLQSQIQGQGFMGLTAGRFPAKKFRVTHSMPDMPWVFRYELALKTDVEGVPWEISSPRRLPVASVMMPAGRTNWPKIDQISETDKNAITQPILPF